MAFSGIAPLLNYSIFPTTLWVRFILELARRYCGNKWILKDFSQELKIHKAFLTITNNHLYNAENQFFMLKIYTF